MPTSINCLSLAYLLEEAAMRGRTAADVTRSDVGLVAIAEWRAALPAQQQAVADAALDAWNQVEWPEGLLSHWCLLGADGHSVLHYIQSVGEDAIRGFV